MALGLLKAGRITLPISTIIVVVACRIAIAIAVTDMQGQPGMAILDRDSRTGAFALGMVGKGRRGKEQRRRKS